VEPFTLSYLVSRSRTSAAKITPGTCNSRAKWRRPRACRANPAGSLCALTNLIPGIGCWARILAPAMRSGIALNPGLVMAYPCSLRGCACRNSLSRTVERMTCSLRCPRPGGGRTASEPFLRRYRSQQPRRECLGRLCWTTSIVRTCRQVRLLGARDHPRLRRFLTNDLRAGVIFGTAYSQETRLLGP